ncbi:MAG: hypothetical protein HY583_03455 [Candidatus Omnitrophica bacterium]|nr:hypothetical protein [Candidatus Omnitrophota bacterium]
MRRSRLWILVLIFLISLPTFVNHFFFWRLERRLGLKVHRKPWVFLLPGSISLNPVLMDWQGYFSVRSGSLKINYPMLSLFTNQYPLFLEGKRLAVQFSPELRKAVGTDQVIFDHFAAKVILKSGRAMDIEFLDAESKTIQFHLSLVPQKQSALLQSI